MHSGFLFEGVEWTASYKFNFIFQKTEFELAGYFPRSALWIF